MNKFYLARDEKGVTNYVRNFSSDGTLINLTANAGVVVSVPSDAYVAIFSYGASADIVVDTLAITLPTAGSSVTSTSEINPSGMIVRNIKELHLLATADVLVKVSFYE